MPDGLLKSACIVFGLACWIVSQPIRASAIKPATPHGCRSASLTLLILSSLLHISLSIHSICFSISHSKMTFHHSAEDIRIDDGHILRARLQRADGEWNDSEIDLNNHIGNDNGTHMPSP